MVIVGFVNFINIICGVGLILIHLFRYKRRRGYLQIMSEDVVGEAVFKIDLFIRNFTRFCALGFLLTLTVLVTL